MVQATAETQLNSLAYTVELPLFQGPLDLLLSLIEQEELDITKISLAQVTDQYLAYLDVIKETDPDELTDFLVIAAKLILIKSTVLLPRPPASVADDDEEDVGDELARQLRLYKKFKEMAVQLQQIEAQAQHSFIRLVPPPKIEPKLIPGEVPLAALLAAARHVLAIKPPEPNVSEMVAPQLVTIGQQMVHIRQRILTHQHVSFNELLSQHRSRLEIIVTLLAVLELIKRHVIIVEQYEEFGEILLRQNETAPQLTEADWEELTELTDVS